MPISKDKNLKYYNENADDYHQRNKGKDLSDLYQAFEEHLTGKRILDLGCGTGRDSAYFSSRGYSIVGVDFSPKMLEIAQLEAPKADFQVMDMTEDLSSLGTFDGVWAMASLLHLSESDFEKTISQVKNILKPDSPFFISIKEEDFCDRGPRDFRYWKKEEALDVFQSNGFKVIFQSEEKTETSHFWSWILLANES